MKHIVLSITTDLRPTVFVSVSLGLCRVEFTLIHSVSHFQYEILTDCKH